MPRRKAELILKPDLSPDRGLQLALVKPKSLVVAGHQAPFLQELPLPQETRGKEHVRNSAWNLAANTFLLLAHTARQANRVGF